MFKRMWSYSTVVILILMLVSASIASAVRARAQAVCQTFPETSQTVCGRFLQYWQAHGRLAQQGYPISGEMAEVPETDGQTYTVQYFERAVFEYHPENIACNVQIRIRHLGPFIRQVIKLEVRRVRGFIL